MAPIARVRSVLNGQTTTRLGLDPSAHYCAADGRSRRKGDTRDSGGGRRSWGLADIRLGGAPTLQSMRCCGAVAVRELSSLLSSAPFKTSLGTALPMSKSRPKPQYQFVRRF